MNFNSILCTFFLWALLLCPSFVWALTLQETLTVVLASNPKLQSSQEQVWIKKEQARQAYAGFLPTVTATGSYSVEEINNSTTRKTRQPTTAALAMNQTLFKGGGVRADYKSAEEGLEEQKRVHEANAQNILLEVVTAYVNLLTAQEVYAQQVGLLQVLEKTAEATQIRFKAGDVTRTDVAQAEARLASIKAGVLQAEGEIINTRLVLEKLLGRSVEDERLLWPLSLPVGIPENIDAALIEAMENHPELLQALHSLRAAKEDIHSAKSGYWPELTANASIARSEGTAARDNTSKKIGLNLTVPLYKGGETTSEVREAVYQHAAAQSDYEVVRRQITEEVYNAVTAHRVAKSSEQAYQTALEASELAAKGVKREEELGQRDTLDVLNAEQELLDAQVDLTRAKADSIISVYRLLAATGRLVDIPLLEPIQSLDPVVVEAGE
ncbi:MAG: TolC family outer membrane protein [Alphaproteobacteria bacterium]|nr:TolC family outer membrane protein [Alphaproteobacteria bacterium]MDD9920388.1 TolC family outer membrane protein [Alphaproteobacteria bacterium]